MPPPDKADSNMPLPRLSDFDTSTFKGRLYGAGAEPAEVEDRRGEADMSEEEKAAAKRRYTASRKSTAVNPDLSGTKLAKDAGYDDMVKMSDEMRMKNRYARK